MKRAILVFVLVAAGFVAGALWTKHRPTPAPPAEAEAGKEAGVAQLSRATNGQTVIRINEQNWKELGIQLQNLRPWQLSPEVKGYGRVVDPAPLTALMTELATVQASYAASSNELSRLTTLESQGNASARSLQTAEAATQRDRAAVQSCRERLTLLVGKAVAEQSDLPDLVRSLSSLDAALVRIDLAAGEVLKEPPTGARIETPSGQSAEAKFLGQAPSVDPQVQGRGYLFLLKPDAISLTAGQSVVGHIETQGEPVPGVVVPRDAVVRAEGAGWVYVANAAADEFTRVEVALDHPLEAGWFVRQGLSAADRVVVGGAQQLLSFELKGAGAEE